MALDVSAEFGLTGQTIDKIRSVLSQFAQLDRAVIYGSRAKGNFRNGSDIDLTLYGDQLTHSDLREIENRIDDLMLAYSFDISLFKHISNLELLGHIERVGKEFFKKKTQSIVP
jgi:uncharacterized protein